MFYQCKKCKKVWQYPIEKCPECFLELERVEKEKVKVIGISKVNIASLLHPKVPYFILLLEDEKGNKWVQKSAKEYKIGEILDFKPNLDKNTVAIWRIKYDILEGIEKVVELLGELEIGSETKIFILPTLITPTHPYLAENTSPQFLENLIKYLINSGAKIENIQVVGQSFDETPIELSAQKSQLFGVCQNFKIFPKDLAKSNFVKLAPYRTEGSGAGPAPYRNEVSGTGKSINGFNFEISEELFNSDLIINLPILKIGKASASENIFKVLKKENYLSLKYLFSEKTILENLNKVLPNYLTIGDGQIVQKPDKFTTFLGLILASFNSFNLDRVFAEISMQKHLPEYLKDVKIENISIVGRQIEELKYDVEKF